ncbi:trypsin alpha-3-like [Leguminivora glycinivorella]|uniref:trypsin alpha-3-like n=1 Tax=Leguminivora glycinivorella TaxID=1035111 RepID=UPI00200BD0B7|nr:trypsin alpha-3-like [Leguminivora glycinivorella]
MFTLFYVLSLAIACSAVSVDVSDATNRIANGAVAANLQFPYAVSIQRIANNTQVSTRGHRCGGALVTLQHVLTAASCMFEWNADGTRTPITIGNYRVFAGAYLLSNDTATERVRNIAQYVVHPNYLGIPSYVGDLAVVTLSTAFASSTATPLSLPANNYNPADFTDCVVAGWGAATAASQTGANVEQKYANKYIYNQQECTSVYNALQGLPNILPTMVCAVSYDIVSSSCHGDEGNALVCGNTLTGILALHSNCAATSYPEIYTRVSNYTDWVRPIVSLANSFTSGASVLLLLTLIQMTFANLLS